MALLNSVVTMELNELSMSVSKVVIHQPLHSFSDCLQYSQSYSYTIDTTVTDQDGKIWATGNLFIPKMYNNTYLVKNRAGQMRRRTPINIARSWKSIYYYKGKLDIYGDDAVTHIHNTYGFYPTVSINEVKGIPLYYLLENAGIDVLARFPDLKHPATNISKFGKSLMPLREDRYPDIILSDNSKSKLNYLFGTLVTDSYVMSIDDVANLYELSLVDPQRITRTTPFDLLFQDECASFKAHFMDNNERREIFKSIAGFWNISKWPNKLFKLSLIQKHIDSYFFMRSKISSSIQISHDTNALEQLGQSRKLYIKTKYDKLTLQYGNDYWGIIDPVATHEGPNTSIRNELSRNVRIDENRLLITVQDKNFNKVELSLLDYFNAKIINNDSWDYETNKVKSSSKGTITVLYRGGVTRTTDLNGYDYIRLDSSSSLTYSSALIPMITKTDPIRLAMATTMLGQAVPVIGCKPPILFTGIEQEIYNKSPLNIKSEVDGVVEDIKFEHVKIRCSDGSTRSYNIPKPELTTSGTVSLFHSSVKVGDKVSSDQVIIHSNSFVDGKLALTTPLRIAYMNFYGYDHDDGIILSEFAAEKLGHKCYETITIAIPKCESYVFGRNELSVHTGMPHHPEFNTSEIAELRSLNELGLIEIGNEVHKGDILFAYMSQIPNDDNSLMKLMTNVTKQIYYTKNITRVPTDVVKGLITDISVEYPTNDNDELAHIRDTCNSKVLSIANETQEFIDRILPTEKDWLEDQPNILAVIKITISYINSTKKADKLANLYGSKGLVTKIVPDDLMPITEDGDRIDIIMSPESVLARKNVSQIWEITMTNICEKAYKVAANLFDTEDFPLIKLRELYNVINVTDKYSNYTDEEIQSLYFSTKGYISINVPALDTKYTKSVVQNIAKYLDLNLDCKKTLTLHDGTQVRNPIVVGTTSIMRLHFFPEYKAKATSSEGGGDEFALGLGDYKHGGQKLGEQEVKALIASNNIGVISSMEGSYNTTTRRNTIQHEFMLLGLALTNDE